MAFLTGEEVVSSISINLRNAFGEQELLRIYKNTAVQGFKKPCAFIHPLDSSSENEMRNRSSWNFLFDVRVHPADEEKDVQSWGRAVGMRLLTALHTVTVSNQTVKAKSASWRIEDNVLHFLVSYGFKVVFTDSAIPQTMDELTFNGGVN